MKLPVMGAVARDGAIEIPDRAAVPDCS